MYDVYIWVCAYTKLSFHFNTVAMCPCLCVCSDEEDAERVCDECVSGALAANPTCVESLYLLGNVRLCQKRREEASAAVSQLVRILLNDEGARACVCVCMC